MTALIILGIIVVDAIVCGLIGSYVATQRGRSDVEGFIFGFLLGPLGVLIAVLMPVIECHDTRPSAGHTMFEADASDGDDLMNLSLDDDPFGLKKGQNRPRPSYGMTIDPSAWPKDEGPFGGIK